MQKRNKLCSILFFLIFILLLVLRKKLSDRLTVPVNLADENNWKKFSLLYNNFDDQNDFVNAKIQILKQICKKNYPNRFRASFEAFVLDWNKRSLFYDKLRLFDLPELDVLIRDFNLKVNNIRSKLETKFSIDDDLDSLKENYYKNLIKLLAKLKLKMMEEEYNSISDDFLTKKSNEVYQKLHSFQYPENCSSVKAMICDVKQLCGFLCQLHFFLICFAKAYYYNRAVIFIDSGNETINRFKYSYEPFGKCGIFQNLSQPTDDNHLNCNDQTIMLSQQQNYFNVFPYHTYTYPSKMIDDLNEVSPYTNDPYAWFTGQFIKHAFVLNNKTGALISKAVEEKQIQKPYFGIHVRRGNKVGLEAKSYTVADYIHQIEKFIDIYRLVNQGLTNPKFTNSTKIVIYISTDEKAVVEEAKKNYPNYEFIYDEERIKKASKYTEEPLLETFQGLLIDLKILSEAEYVVCTMTSNVCRYVYELMQGQQRHIDPHYRIKSLDSHFHVHAFNTISKVAVLPHRKIKRNEINLKTGDIIYMPVLHSPTNEYDANLWNGYMKGTNLRTGKRGLFPSYKVKNYYSKIYKP